MVIVLEVNITQSKITVVFLKLALYYLACEDSSFQNIVIDLDYRLLIDSKIDWNI